MSKEQVIYDGNANLGHCTSGGNSKTKFVFSKSEPFGHIKITLIYDKGNTHIEEKHEIMDSFVPYLIDWLKENNPKGD